MVMLSTKEEKPKSARNSPEKAMKSEANGQVNGINSITSHEKVVDEIQFSTFLQSLQCSHQEVLNALFEALFEGVGKGFCKEIAKNKNYLAASVHAEGSKMQLLNAIESFCGKASPEAVKEAALALKALAKEEFILEWYEKSVTGGNKGSPIWKSVKPFVEWLQSAESE